MAKTSTRVRLQGLREEARHEIEVREGYYFGDELLNDSRTRCRIVFSAFLPHPNHRWPSLAAHNIKSPGQTSRRRWHRTRTNFDFTEERLINLAKKAKECGVELFVLDDGWFGQRSHERAGLGDWVARYYGYPPPPAPESSHCISG